jgi:hypothetical protein
MRWKLVSGVLALACIVLQAVPVMVAAEGTSVTGTVPLVIYGVNASAIGSDSATIVWKTNGGASSQVFYDTEFHQNITDYAFHTPNDTTPVTTHSVPLTGLSPSITYHYRARSVAAVGGTAFIATSDDYNFTTTGQAIKVISPNGGEYWTIGSSQTINWIPAGVTGNVRIQLSRNGGSTWTTIIASTPNDGSQAWRVTWPATNQARIKVVSIANPAISDISDGNFTITWLGIWVISPDGGERWAVGTNHIIWWISSGGLTGNVSIELSRDGGSNWTTIVASTRNDGSQAWSVTGPATTQARIKVVSVANPAIFDISDDNFTITGTIRVISPNGCEHWAVGSNQTINWTSAGVTGNVSIGLSRDGGSSWTTIIASTHNDGSQAWTVTGPATTRAKIKVVSIDDPTVFDISDGNFAITVTIRVISPNGGEHWAVGSTQTINWTSAGVTGNVRIELSRNGGTSWTTIIASTGNDGSQAWSVTGTATTRARIKVVSIDDPTVFDTSDGDFAIRS